MTRRLDFLKISIKLYRNYFDDSKNWAFFFNKKKHDSQNWTIFFHVTHGIEPFFPTWLIVIEPFFFYMTQKIEPFLEYDSKSWKIFMSFWLKELNIFWIWLEKLNLFFFLERDSQNWTFFRMTQRFCWKRLKESISFFFFKKKLTQDFFWKICSKNCFSVWFTGSNFFSSIT